MGIRNGVDSEEWEGEEGEVTAASCKYAQMLGEPLDSSRIHKDGRL